MQIPQMNNKYNQIHGPLNENDNKIVQPNTNKIIDNNKNMGKYKPLSEEIPDENEKPLSPCSGARSSRCHPVHPAIGRASSALQGAHPADFSAPCGSGNRGAAPCLAPTGTSLSRSLPGRSLSNGCCHYTTARREMQGECLAKGRLSALFFPLSFSRTFPAFPAGAPADFPAIAARLRRDFLALPGANA